MDGKCKTDTIFIPSNAWTLGQLKHRDISCAWMCNHILQTPVADISFLGVPEDFFVNYRPGARFAPDKIRTALASNTTFVMARNVCLDNLSFFDYGDIFLNNTVDDIFFKLEDVVSKLDSRICSIVLGGDHYITGPLIKGYAKSVGSNIGLVSIDAHCDSRPPVLGKEHSGNWMRPILDGIYPCIEANNIAIVGLSSGLYSPEYFEEFERLGALTMTVSDARHFHRNNCMIEKILYQLKNVDKIYITLDIDAVDQSQAPGTSAPNPNGLSADIIFDLLFELGKTGKIAFFDITEVNPLVDINDMTSRLASEFILHLLAGISVSASMRDSHV